MTYRRILVAVATVATVSGGARAGRAQESNFVTVDRVVAVVGRRPIAESQIDEQLMFLQNTTENMPNDSAAVAEMRQQILERLIDEELLVQAAERDTMVVVTEEEVQRETDDRMRSVQEQFPTTADFQQSLLRAGFVSVDEYRVWTSENVRRQMMQNALVQVLSQKGDIRPIPPTEAELRTAYEEQVAQQQTPRPPTVSFRQIIVKPLPDSAAMIASFLKAESLMVRARRGEDFASLARQYSMEPGADQSGGELGWFRRGVMATEFEAVAFRLRPGQISNVVQTSFGFHVIQVLRSDPAEVQARHILIIPEVTDANRAAARERAESVATALRDGATLDTMIRKFHDRDEQSYADRVVRGDLPPEYQGALADATAGEVVGPFAVDRRGVEKYAVVLFLEALAEGEYTFEEVRDRLREQLAEQNGRQRYLEILRETTYIDIRN